jgi:peptidoglycan-N-acetylglucosamine deacetylase
MYLIRPPFVMRWLYPEALFRMRAPKTKDVYLTFDDGPCPQVTPFVLDVLAEEQVPATFFLLGKNAEQHPQLLERIRAEGHAVGNHGQEHINGWSTSTDAYVQNWERAVPLLGERHFRPPYGRITPAQYSALRPRTTICLWDVISGDFDASLTPEQCLDNVVKNVRQGSIIVMHDSLKARTNVESSLKPIIRSIKAAGYALNKL